MLNYILLYFDLRIYAAETMKEVASVQHVVQIEKRQCHFFNSLKGTVLNQTGHLKQGISKD